MPANKFHTQFIDYLRKNNLRETYERRVISHGIEAIGATRFNIDDLEQKLIQQGERISKATIYNNVTLMLDARLLARHQFDSGQYFYEVNLNKTNDNRLHLICTTCGKITNLKNSQIVDSVTEMKFGRFNPDYITLSVYGTCSRCARKARLDKLKN